MSAVEPKSFAPKEPVSLAPPKDDPITPDQLALCNGSDPSKPVYVAIKGTVFDVTGNKSYVPGGSYHIFAGKDASRALAKSSVQTKDAVPEWSDLPSKEKDVLKDWHTFFSKRYNIVGKIPGGANL